MPDLIVKKSRIGQFKEGLGVFAGRDFKKGEIVVKYNLRALTKEEYKNLPPEEKKFTHKHWGVTYLYPVPARYVNHSDNHNTIQNLKERYDVASRDIKKGEEITTDSTKDDAD